MATAAIVYDGVPSTNGGEGGLFNGIKFWFSSTVPQRNHFKAQVESNGGKVVNSDKDADVLLVDHKRRNNPPGSYSYQFVENSIRSGKLENREDYLAGPAAGTIRPMGSTTIPAKGRRVPFTAEDDQILYDFMKPFEESGGKIFGQLIYKQLEELHPNHTFQSWRERYLKKVRDRPRPPGPVPAQGQTAANRTPSPRASSEGNRSRDAAGSSTAQNKYESFTEDDKHILLNQAKDVLRLDPTKEGEAWSQFAQEKPTHSAEEWKSYFNDVILPEYRKEKARKNIEARNGKSPASAHQQKSPRPPSSGAKDTSVPSVVVRKRTEENQTAYPNRQQREQTQENNNKNKRRHSIAMERWQTVSAFEDDESSRSRKRRATDYVVREIPSTPERSGSPEEHRRRHEQRASLSPLFCPSQSPTPRRRSGSPVSRGKRPTTQAEREGSTSTSNSRNEQFETAPQYQHQSNGDEDNGAESQLIRDLNEELFHLAPPPQKQKPRGQDNSESASAPSKSAPDDEENEIKRLDAWISTRLQSGKATDEMQLITALSCTSMDPNMADKVLEYLVAGKGIPTNMRGVWTKEDDEGLEASDGRAVLRVQEKHGMEGFNRRFEYLEMQRRAEMERRERGG